MCPDVTIVNPPKGSVKPVSFCTEHPTGWRVNISIQDGVPTSQPVCIASRFQILFMRLSWNVLVISQPLCGYPCGSVNVSKGLQRMATLQFISRLLASTPQLSQWPGHYWWVEVFIQHKVYDGLPFLPAFIHSPRVRCRRARNSSE